MRDLFFDYYGLRPWAFVAILLIAIGVVTAGSLWLYDVTNGGCAQNYHAIITGYVPMVVGKVVTMVPVTSCVAN